MKKYILGVDIGGTATKAVLFDIQGNNLGCVSQATPVIITEEGHNERDMMDLWQVTAKVIKEVITKSGVDKEKICAVGCTGHGKGLYLWGKDNKPACNAIASTDNRGQDIVDSWQDQGITMKHLTLQKPIPCHPLTLLAWMKANKSDVYGNIKWVFSAKDYIRFMLTGEAYSEVTDASGSCLMNQLTRAYDEAILTAYGVPEVLTMLPSMKKSHEHCGNVTDEAAKVTGLPNGVPVCAGMFDIHACGIAMNMMDSNPLCMITGTWSINEYIARKPVTNNETTLNSIYALPEYYLIEESSPTSAGNLEWFVQQLDINKCQLEGEEIYDTINRLVEEENSIVEDLFFLPFLYGSNTKKPMKGSFLGLTLGTTTGQLLRAIYEGVAFSHYTHVGRLLDCRAQPTSIRVAGGATRSKVWLQIIADVIGIPLEVIEEKELGAMGVAIAAGVGAGLFDSYEEAMKEMVHFDQVIQPDKQRHVEYVNKYKGYSRLIAALQEIG